MVIHDRLVSPLVLATHFIWIPSLAGRFRRSWCALHQLRIYILVGLHTDIILQQPGAATTNAVIYGYQLACMQEHNLWQYLWMSGVHDVNICIRSSVCHKHPQSLQAKGMPVHWSVFELSTVSLTSRCSSAALEAMLSYWTVTIWKCRAVSRSCGSAQIVLYSLISTELHLFDSCISYCPCRQPEAELLKS